MNTPDDKPRKTITIMRKPATAITAPATATTAPATHQRGGKRVITRDQLPAAHLTKPGKFEKPKPKPAKTNRKPRKPVKPKKPKPSALRARELNDSLNNYPVWLDCKPLAIGIEKELFRHIADLQLSASKRVVQKLMYYHTNKRSYLMNVGKGGARYRLDGTTAGEVLPFEREHAGRVLAAMPQTA